MEYTFIKSGISIWNIGIYLCKKLKTSQQYVKYITAKHIYIYAKCEIYLYKKGIYLSKKLDIYLQNRVHIFVKERKIFLQKTEYIFVKSGIYLCKRVKYLYKKWNNFVNKAHLRCPSLQLLLSCSTQTIHIAIVLIIKYITGTEN